MSSFTTTILSLLKIAIVVMLLGVVFVIAGYLGVSWSLGAEEFEVPDVKGMEVAQATDVLSSQGLIVEVDPQRLTDNEVPEG
ncbi:MAG: PASTA domain-containing protein, partial [Acidobacteriota bacterium]